MRTQSIVTAHMAVVLLGTASVALAAQSPQDFVRTAIQGDNTEAAMGQLAQQKGSTAAVRSFGQTLVQDHDAGKQDMMDLAKQLNVPVNDDAMTADAGAIRTKLSNLSGLAFDGAFADAMVADHIKDIELYRDEAAANNGPASTWAAKQVPVLQKHLKMAQDIQQSAAGGALKANNGTPSGFLADEGDQWRGSKLIGVNIYGPNNQKVGGISDVLVDRDGRISYVVVGVGGFLGIGEKNVAIPFDRVTFSQEPMMSTAQVNALAQPANTRPAADTGQPMNAGTTPTNNLATPAGTGIAPATSVGLGTSTNGGIATANNPPAGMVAPNALQPRSMAYPDHGVIDYTADQLKSAPTFSYAK